ncbi:MAG: hypothetical protein AB1601_15225 [Planctomycetota bacterium]
MSLLDQQIDRARRRLTVMAFVEHLSYGVLVAAGLWAIGIVVVRLAAWSVPLWHGGWMAAAAAAIFALAAAVWKCPGPLGAAIVLDAAAGLKERLSTALVVQRSNDPFARAAVSDAERSAGRVHVPTHIRYRAPALWPWSLATVGAAVLLAAFLPPLGVFAGERRVGPSVSPAELEAEQHAIQTALDRQLDALQELARDNPNLKDIAEALTPLDPTPTPQLTPEDLRREAVKRLDAAGDKLRQELAAAEGSPAEPMRRMLEGLSAKGGEQAGAKLSRALAEGDFGAAQGALAELQAQTEGLDAQAGDPAAQRQLGELRSQLEELAKQIEGLDNTLAMQKELENKAGLSEAQARELLEELARLQPEQFEELLRQRLSAARLTPEQLRELAQCLAQQQQACGACRQLCQSLRRAAGTCPAGSRPAGGAGCPTSALGEGAAVLAELGRAQQMRRDLAGRLAELEKLRQCISRGQCRQAGAGGTQYGFGHATGPATDMLPRAHSPTRARSRVHEGAILGSVWVDGPQRVGHATAEARQAAAAEVRDALDAIEREEVPPQYHRVLREYFDRLAGLTRAPSPAKEPEPNAPEGALRGDAAPPPSSPGAGP